MKNLDSVTDQILQCVLQSYIPKEELAQQLLLPPLSILGGGGEEDITSF